MTQGKNFGEKLEKNLNSEIKSSRYKKLEQRKRKGKLKQKNIASIFYFIIIVAALSILFFYKVPFIDIIRQGPKRF